MIDGTPLQRLGAIGHAYLKCANDNRIHFKVISDHQLIDYDGSLALQASSASICAQMQQLLTEKFAAQSGALDLAMVQLASRALVYGLARMMADGHFTEWSPPGTNCDDASSGALGLFVDLLSGRSMFHVSWQDEESS